MKNLFQFQSNWSKTILLSLILLVLLIGGLALNAHRQISSSPTISNVESEGGIISGSFDTKSFKSDAQWKKILTPDQYNILRKEGTETPFTGALLHEERKGTFYSVGCNKPVFRSEQKYDSGTGWPSFWAPINKDAVVLRKDTTLGIERIEVLDQCGGHLGHVFDDGPEPTGKRYCMNSIALRFVPDEDQKK